MPNCKLYNNIIIMPNINIDRYDMLYNYYLIINCIPYN